MQAIKVIIDNWPNTSFLAEWIPIIISLLVLLATFYSLWITNKNFRKSVRPFVSASNVLEPATNIDNPKAMAFIVRNAPAKIIKCEFRIISNNVVLHEKDCGANTIEYPQDEKSIWAYSLNELDFDHIKIKANLIREVLIEYCPIDDNKKYIFKLIQNYDYIYHKWNNRNIIAS